MRGRIHSFESFGTVDGPGVRYVVFFQGCPLRCKYCHNPDTWAINGGNEYTVREILDKMERNITFYKTGGITATGGEPMLQLDFLTELFETAKKEGINTCLDTSGIVFDSKNEERLKKIDRLIKSCDLVMLDIKHTDTKEHAALTGAGNENVLEFLRYLDKNGVKTRLRQVIVPGLTDKEEQLNALAELAKGLSCLEKIELLPYHDMGKVKYDALGLSYPFENTPVADSTLLQKCYEVINKRL